MQTREANKQLIMPDRTTFVVVASGSNNDGAEVIFEITMAPGAIGPPRHTHPAQEESWTVQTGELSILVDNQWRTLEAGESLTIPPGTPHTLANRSAAGSDMPISPPPTATRRSTRTPSRKRC
jgi:quercetin dioxygenase-like cupin family protein